MQGKDSQSCECGCGETTTPNARFRSGHNRRRTLDEYHVDPNTGCWIWARALNAYGYGAMWDMQQKRVRRAHRVFYERYIGPIPGGLVVDHLCRNPACVNPTHLEAVTDAVNLRRGSRTRLTEDDVEALRRLSMKVTCSRRQFCFIVAPIYDVKPGTIAQAVAGTKKWRKPRRRKTNESMA
jgi:hypothetical protein